MPQSLSLSGRIAVVTGASSGIGEATARQLASHGAAVALFARRKDRLEALATDIRNEGGRVLAVAVDVKDRKAIAEGARVVAGELGVVDLVVNNAGVVLPWPVDAHRMDDFEHTIDVNFTGAVRVVDAFVEPLVAAASRGGRADLVNISSIGAHHVYPNLAVYGATKAALTHLSRNLRTELGPKNVRVSVIEPGLVETELEGHVVDESVKQMLASAHKITWLNAADVAEAIVHLAGLPRHVNIERITLLSTQQV